LWAHRGDLFTFLRQPGLDATNWRAELAIRFGVILRKVWGGNRTWAGARAQSVLMSVWRTCWQHGRSALDFLSQLLRGPPSHDGALRGLNAWLAVGDGTLKSHDGRGRWPDLGPVLY
jgi:transposase